MFHVTQVKRKLKQRLSDELPGRLVEADGADPVTFWSEEMGQMITVATPVPHEIYTTDKVDIGGLPSLELIVTDSTPQVNSYVQMYRHRIVVGVSAGHDREEVVSAQLEHYLWAIRQIIRDLAITPIEGTSFADTGGEQYTPLQQRPETVEYPFVKGAFIEVFVTTVE